MSRRQLRWPVRKNRDSESQKSREQSSSVRDSDESEAVDDLRADRRSGFSSVRSTLRPGLVRRPSKKIEMILIGQ